MLIRLAAGRSISENDSDPTRQGHPGIPPGVHPQKSTLAQPLNLIKSGAITPVECDIAQSSQIAHAEIPLHPGSLQRACEFDHKDQSAEERAKKQKLNIHANRQSDTQVSHEHLQVWLKRVCSTGSGEGLSAPSGHPFIIGCWELHPLT